MNRQIASARIEGRGARARFGGRSDGLLDRLRGELQTRCGLELVPVDSEKFLQGSRGELVLAETCIYYDARLESRSAELLEVLAHEYGHLLLHHEEFGPASDDLLRGSAFLKSGAGGLSRYSPRSLLEAEASAFAAEFICPSRECFERWSNDTASSAEKLAHEFGATHSLIRLQLAEGLYEFVAGTGEPGRDHASQPASNHEQERAALAFGLPVLVDAGPGTGKTKTLVRRVEYLVQERNVPSERILILTFSNEAAGELQDRIQSRLGADAASRLLVSTFHGFGVVLLNLFGHHVGLGVDYSILDEICQEELISELLGVADCEALLNIKNLDETIVKVTQTINFLKDRLVGSENLKLAIDEWKPSEDERDTHARAEALQRIYRLYESEKRKRQLVDFADLIQIPYELLHTHEGVRQNLRSEFPWVMVDEYQDVSRATALLLQEVCGDENPPWVVGDARQAIYRFRGAAPENVRDFTKDFPRAKVFQLTENYRSSPEIIAILNRMASWLENSPELAEQADRWKPGRSVSGGVERAVRLATANNDLAERRGVVEAVRQWMSEGVQAEEIAILARRNLDVRNIAIELKKSGIQAVTSGLLTAEGTGGDLSSVLTSVDHQQALSRVMYALRGKDVPRKDLDAAVSDLLHANPDEPLVPASAGSETTIRLVREGWKVYQDLRIFLHSGDGWTVLCEFAFFLTPYARNLLNRTDDADGAVRLEELLSALALAAGYRFTHPRLRPRLSRLGLAERMRELVTHSAPGLVPPRNKIGSVRVLTCHASKGLEFPRVCVVGQSLAEVRESGSFLPPRLRPDPNDDLLQAESLLFVGVSRAERAVLISSAESASGKPKSKIRRVPSLLEKLRGVREVPTLKWTAEEMGEEEVVISRVWGGAPPQNFSTFSLSKEACHVKTYLEEQLGARFRGRERSLYPDFIQSVRRTLRKLLESAIASNRKVSESESTRIAVEEWPDDRHVNHAHVRIYRPRLIRWARMFANAFDPSEFVGAKLNEGTFDCPDAEGNKREVRLQLVAEFVDVGGDRYAIALQVRGAANHPGGVKWSGLKEYERLPFVLLQDRHGKIEPLVFFGEEGQITSFKWSTRKPEEAIRDQAEYAREAVESLSSGQFKGKLTDWTCDRCNCRTICPGWLLALAARE
jgi:DNA helicase II / ATP-dependent DNA helicase PcrA